MLTSQKYARVERLLDGIAVQHPDIAEAVRLVANAVFESESELIVDEARLDAAERRLDRLEGLKPSRFAEEQGSAAQYVSQCPEHGLIRLDGKCSRCLERDRLIHNAPDYPVEREREFEVKVLRLAETVRPRVAEQHEGHQCVWPCIVHDPEAFVVNALGQTPAGRALGVRKEA